MEELEFKDIRHKYMNHNELSLTIAIPTLNSAETIHIPMKSIANQKKK